MSESESTGVVRWDSLIGEAVESLLRKLPVPKCSGHTHTKKNKKKTETC